jgi:hypothetical protein
MDLNGNGVPDECEGVGDANCNHTVGSDDINAFVMRLSNPATYAATHPNRPDFNDDINGDGSVNSAGINPFVALMVGK